MNSRDRILHTIEGKEVDRVPVCLFIHDEGNFLRQVYPDLDLSKPLECKYRLVNLQRDYGLDLFIRLLHGIFPHWIVYGGVNTETHTENWVVSTHEERTPYSILLKTTVQTPAGTLYQEFTISESSDVPDTYWYACTKKPIKSLADLEILMEYEPPMKSSFPEHARNIIAPLKEYLGEDGVLSVWVPGGAYNHASLLIELNELYSLFLTDYHFYEKLMNFCIKRTLPFIKALVEAGVDILNIGGNVPGGFLGPGNYEKYILPFEKQYIENARRLGVKTLYHNCGEIMALAGSYKKLKADIVEPFAPPPLGDGDLAKAKEISQGAYTIIGNVDQVNVLKNGSIEDVKEVTRRTVETGKKGGRYILQTADYLEYGTPIDNVKAFIETGLRYGKY
ncbi:MAG: uroporphyrinogen decarboxylase family protein [Spirochaetota bacterium]